MSLFSNMSIPAQGFTHPPSPCVPVRNMWVETSTLPYTFMVWCLTKCMHNFTFCHYCGCYYMPGDVCTNTAKFTAVGIDTVGASDGTEVCSK